jgi:NitT/TauT family transport system ATP-binding protein
MPPIEPTTPSSAVVTDPGGGTGPAAIELGDLAFGFENGPAILESINLRIRPSEIIAIIGPSGCGKSTLLNLIAGLLRPTSGSVTCSDKAVNGPNHRVTYMTQKDTLLPWRTALSNAALPLEIRGVPRKERYAQARAALARVGVADAEARRPHQLSGGMRSRLALARAMLCDTEIILMDEPFAAVDAIMRVRLLQLLLSIWQETQRTFVYVTHDLTEAIALGHRVLVMSSQPGRIVLEREITAPHPRDVVRVNASEEAQQVRVELWDALQDGGKTQ